MLRVDCRRGYVCSRLIYPLGEKKLTYGQHHAVLTNSSISAGLFRARTDTKALPCRLQYRCVLECEA